MFTDSSASAAKEILVFFPDFNIEQWYNTHETDFRLRNVAFNETIGIHEPVNTASNRLQ
jgi:hypothetical protein